MSGISIDASELRDLAKDLSKAHYAVGPHVVRAVEKGALNVKKTLQSQARKSRHFRGFASAISYDVRAASAFGGAEVVAEVGPTKGAPGSLANIAYFGTSRGGGTVPEPGLALQEEAPQFEKFMDELLDRFAL